MRFSVVGETLGWGMSEEVARLEGGALCPLPAQAWKSQQQSERCAVLQDMAEAGLSAPPVPGAPEMMLSGGKPDT